MNYKVVLLRHGESTWNKENRFTGWTDIDLSEKGVEEARSAGDLLEHEGFTFDIAFTSYLKRATRTLDIVLDTMSLSNIPVTYAWQLNEKHYGALQGLNKTEMVKKYGEEKVFQWRRVYTMRPPELSPDDERHPRHDERYIHIDPTLLPSTESLEDVVARVIPYWTKEIAPAVCEGKHILIAAHGNSLRALVKYLDHIPDGEIADLNIPTGIPLVYELDADLEPITHYYLGDQDKVEAAIHAVVKQGKV